MKDNKGITLIALTVTIIVMIILASVSVTNIVSDNGTFNKSVKIATDEQLIGVQDEVNTAITRLAYYENVSSDVGIKNISIYNMTSLQKYLDGRLNGVYRKINGDTILYYTKDDISYTVTIGIQGKISAKSGIVLYSDGVPIIEVPVNDTVQFSTEFEDVEWKFSDGTVSNSIAEITKDGEFIRKASGDIYVRGYDKNNPSKYVEVKIQDKVAQIDNYSDSDIIAAIEQINNRNVITNVNQIQNNPINPTEPEEPSNPEKPIEENTANVYRLGDNVYGTVIDSSIDNYTFKLFINGSGTGTMIANELYTNNKINIPENESIKRLIIGEGINHLSKEAFGNFVNLEYLYIPTSWKGEAYNGSSPFKGLKNLKVIDYNAINANNDVKKNYFNIIGIRIEKINIGKNVEVIPINMFYNCFYRGTITIPSNVKEIGSYAFGDNYISEVNLSEGLEVIGKGAFKSNYMENIIFPNSLKEIGDHAFQYSRLKNIQFGNSLKKIGKYAFEYNTGLEEFTIPESVEEIGANILDNCYSIHKINYYAINATYNYDDLAENYEKGKFYGIVNCGVYFEGGRVGYGNTPITGVSIDTPFGDVEFDSETDIAIFMDNYVTEINIGSNVKKIPDYIFYDLRKLESLTIPASVEEIGNYAFYGCHNMQNLTFESGIKNIGNSSFEMCYNLTSVEIPNTIKQIGIKAFEHCPSMETFILHKASGTVLNYPWGLFDKLGTIPEVDTITYIFEDTVQTEDIEVKGCEIIYN